MAGTALQTSDILNSNTGHLYFTINGVMRRAAECRQITASLETSVEEFRLLHECMWRHKGVGIKGSGSMTIYTGTNDFLTLITSFKKSWFNQRFTIISTSTDPESSRGSRSIRLMDVLLAGHELFKHDTADGILDSEVSFTFDNYEVVSDYNDIDAPSIDWGLLSE